MNEFIKDIYEEPKITIKLFSAIDVVMESVTKNKDDNDVSDPFDEGD